MARDRSAASLAASLEERYPGIAASSSERSGVKWLVATLFFITFAALLFSLQLFQLTSEGTSKRTLRRSVSVLTEIDPLIDRNYDDLRERAASAAPDDELRLREYPIDVPLTRAQAQTLSKPDLREVLLDRSAGVMYSHGTAPLRASASGRGSVGAFSVGGITNHGLGFLRKRNHDILAVLTFVLAALSAILGVSLVALCRGFGRVAAVGGVVFAASAPMLLIALGARLYMSASGDNEYLQREFLSIGRGLLWIPIRNGIVFTLLGALMLAMGVALARWSDRGEAAR